MKLVYLSHPMTHYDQKEEKICLDIIDQKLPYIIDDEIEIFNPNQVWIKRFMENRKRDDPVNSFSFFIQIVEVMDIVVGVPFKDRKLGAGVAKEIQVHLKNNKPAYLIDIFLNEITLFQDFERHTCLGINETRERIKMKIK